MAIHALTIWRRAGEIDSAITLPLFIPLAYSYTDSTGAGAMMKKSRTSISSCSDLVIFPSTVIKPQTAFTFDALDHFLIDTLECKTSARSFYQKLCQLSNNAFLDSLPVSLSTTACFLLYIVIQDCYHELLRVSRMWRDLSNRKWAGFGHDTERYPGPGDLAIFCPSCPQPGINLPENWREVYTSLFFSICGQGFDY